MNDADRTVILIAPGFDLDAVVSWTSHLRRSGRPVSVVSLTAGPVRSKIGIRLIADENLDTAANRIPGLVLLPAGMESSTWFARDPRVTRFLADVDAQGGRIASTQALQVDIPDLDISIFPATTNGSYLEQDFLDAIQGSQGKGIGLPKP